MVRKTQPLAQAMKGTEWPKIYSDGAYEMYARPGMKLDAVDYREKVFAGRFP